MSRRHRVLLIAEACNPAWTSVPLVGFNQARAIARHPAVDAVVATQVRNREGLEADPRSAELDLVYVDTEWVARPFHRLATSLRGGNNVAWTIETAMAIPSYLSFERRLARQLGAALDDFDVIHRVTPVSLTHPSSLAKRSSVPMVIGPVNGGLPFPREFSHFAKEERELLLKLRPLHNLIPYSRSTLGDLEGLIVASSFTEATIPRRFKGLRMRLSENGIDSDVFPIADHWSPPVEHPFRFVTAGRLVPSKGFDMIIEAFAGIVDQGPCELHVIGDGAERQALEQLAARLGVADSVVFHGWVEQRRMSEVLRSSQAFVFASIKEFGGGVVLEAMASALPCIVLDYGGPADLVDDAGLLVPMQPRPGLVRELERTMGRLRGDLELCRELGDHAAAHIRQHYTWAAKADQIVEFYEQVRDLTDRSRRR